MRCYNGAWDSEATALFAEEDRVMDLIRAKEPEAHCTQIPTPGSFVVHVWGRFLGEERPTKLAALLSALDRLGLRR